MNTASAACATPTNSVRGFVQRETDFDGFFFVLAGDADHNRVINFDDYSIIDFAFNTQ